MIRFIRRHAAFLAVIFAIAGVAAPASTLAQAPADAQKAAPADAQPAATQPAATPPAAAPAPAPAPMAPTVSKETIENPYGLEALWRQGDWVSKGTLVILFIMSLGSWYIIFVKLWEQAKLIREGREMRGAFWKAPSLRDGAKRLKDGSAYRYIAETGIDANEHHEGALTENIDLNTWVTMQVQRAVDGVQSRTQDGLAFLATVGSTAPFVGLFGTVWGIYHALTAIGIAGQASIDKVAGPVGEALIMTAIGLAVAVPAVMGYNWLVRRNKSVMEAVRAFGADVHAVLLGRRPDVRVAAAAR
jgi:biopolymer transport protein ExbB